MQQVSSKLHKHTNRTQKNKQTHMQLEETSAPKLERATKRTPRTRNVNTAPSTPNTLEDTHLARKTAEHCGSNNTQYLLFWQTRSSKHKTTPTQHTAQQNTASNSTACSRTASIIKLPTHTKRTPEAKRTAQNKVKKQRGSEDSKNNGSEDTIDVQ